jgi:TatD DNase family protein
MDTINILKKYNVKGVIHSFSGSLEIAKEYIKMGYLLGINGVVTFKNSNLKNTLKELSIDNIILETDSPYLTPEPNRGKQNSPKYILDIAKYLCEIYDVSLDELSIITNNNIKRIFNV